MSLNGLDTQPIQDAYQAAITEPGGWFLMKYCTRDAVELLAQGKSGVNGARNAIAKYDEPSPLYGLLIYRRRKVLIKFIPEGTSRLLQARTAVHFQDVLERYSPYETLLEITNSESLNDTSLASAFPLHTASPAISSNRLHEISEDAEDGGSAPAERPLNSSASTGNVFGTQRYKMERRVEQIMQPDRAPPSIRVTGDAPPSPTSPSTKTANISQYLIREDLGRTSIRPLDPPRSIAPVTGFGASDDASSPRPDSAAVPAAALAVVADRQRNELPSIRDVNGGQWRERPLADTISERAETPVERPSISDAGSAPARTSTSASDPFPKYDDDPYDFSRFDYKPKVKLGPRPVTGSDIAKRPTTASVAGLPALYRPASKKSEPTRPKSQGLASAVSPTPTPTAVLPLPPPIPSSNDYQPRPVSRGSVKSMPSNKSAAMTPDKLRLMKAVELRKRQLRKSNPQDTFQPPVDEDAPPIPALPTTKSVQTSPIPGELAEDDLTENGIPSLVNKPDSGIEMHYDQRQGLQNQPKTQDSGHPSTIATALPSEDEQTPILPVIPVAESFNVTETHPEVLSDNAAQGLLPSSMIQGGTVDDPIQAESSDETIQAVAGAASDPTPVPTVTTVDSLLSPSPEDKSAEDEQPDDAPDGDAPTLVEEEMEPITPSADVSPISHKRQVSDLAKRRRGYVEPLQIDVNALPRNPDEFASDDDDFLEELRTAPVEQAKPIHVAKSPANVELPGRRPSTASGISDNGASSVKSIRIKKSTAIPIERSLESLNRLSPEPAQVPHYTPTGMREKQDATSATGLARNVSSGISKRIQALAEVSARESSLTRDGAPSRPLTPETSPNAFLQRDQRERNAMVRNAQKSRPMSFRKQSSKSSVASGSPRVNGGGNSPILSVQRDSGGNRNSVSVTARIVRADAVQETGSANSRLQPSELRISTAPTHLPLQQVQSEPAESVYSMGSPGALSPPLSPISTESRSTSRFSRKPTAPSPSPEDFPPPPSRRSATGASPPTDENASAKEGSRTSRFLKRMSNFGAGGKRKSGPQRSSAASSAPSTEYNTAKATESKTAPAVEKPDTPPAVVVGDLNVQFPDSLLWKRRIVTIDETGHLQFAIAHAMDIHKSVAVKKFPMADFKLPYAPDLDYQELPHSVVLEFSDGTTLQVACEDSMTHRQVLHLLKTHWKAWAQSV